MQQPLFDEDMEGNLIPNHSEVPISIFDVIDELSKLEDCRKMLERG